MNPTAGARRGSWWAPGDRTRHSSPLANLRIRYLLLGCFVYFVVAMVLLAGMSSGLPDATSWVLVVTAGLYLVALVWLMHQVQRRGLDPQALVGSRSLSSREWRLVWLAIPIQLAFYGLTWLMGTLLSDVATPRPAASGSRIDIALLFREGGLYPAWLVVILALGPIIEELVFRGVILNRWGYKWGIRRGVIFSSILFGLAHPGFAWAFAVGVVLSLMYIATRSLLVPILCHMIVNALSESAEILYDLLPWTDRIARLTSLQGALIGIAALLMGVVPVSVFILRHWPAKDAPIPYSD